ncbi:MAG: hypothetical protein GWO24_09255, partial [Akkermansiaceae bacterium]|nr:hypothetical protein [Akkermansiaceae bacterium]
MNRPRCLLAVLVLPGLLPGQQVANVDSVAAGRRSADHASVTTRTDARTITLSIPAPRGLLTDRNGEPLAQNKVGYQFALEFEHFKKPTDELILQWARLRLSRAGKMAGRRYS